MRALIKSVSIVGLMLAVSLVAASTANAGWWHRHHVRYWGGYHFRWHRWYAPYVRVYRPVVVAPRIVYRPYTPVYVSYGLPYVNYRTWYAGCSYPAYGCWDPCGGCYTAVPCGGCYPSATSGTPVQSSQPATGTPTPAPAATPTPAPTPAPPPAPAPAPAPDPGLPPDPAPLPPEPADAPPDLNLPPTPANPRDASDDQLHNGALLTLDVPEDARVYINGLLTSTPGSRRTYVSRGLEPGYRYTYEIRVEAIRDGRPVHAEQVVELLAGQTRTLAMDLRQVAPAEPARGDTTTLVVHLPADARLALEGTETAAAGTTRKFKTAILKPGERWQDYRVVAHVQRNGRQIVRERTLTLVGGQTQEVTFDFSADQVALR